MLQSPVEFFRNLPKKVCPECGQHMLEQAESYLMECDRCLSKKEEQLNEKAAKWPPFIFYLSLPLFN